MSYDATPYEALCSAIRSEGYKVRESRNHSASSQCPGHGSWGYSLSIRETDDGTVLLHCFAGCNALDVLDVLGMTARDLFPTRVAGWSE